jgi:NAD(P)H dehydrogenase (quinone)
MESILITGASGRLGGAIVAALAARIPRERLRVLVRTASVADDFGTRGVTARLGDYTDRRSLVDAFAGVDRLVFVSSPAHDPAIRVPQHRAVVSAAVAAGVRRIVYTSAFGAVHDPGHATTEALLAERFGHGDASGATILRNGLYTEPFVDRALAESVAGQVTSATDRGALATASIVDLAEAAALAVLRPPARAVLELRGPAWTYDELAALLSSGCGRPVVHERVGVEAAGAFGPVHAIAARGGLAAESGDLSALLGRPPRTLADVVRSAVMR